MSSPLTLQRDVYREECPWLDEDLPKGTQVFKSTGPTYGVIGPSGIAVSMQPGEEPFFEVPADAVGLPAPYMRPDPREVKGPRND